ncbi:MAG: lysophospholipid acyltransferase family protein [Thermodesulfobacteriota bacterium]
MIRTLVPYILSVFFTTFWGLLGLIFALFSNYMAITYAVRPWGKTMLWAWGVKLKVEGLENLPEGTSMIMYNHQSSFDILAFSAGLPLEWKAIMKKEVLHMPFVGWVSKLSGHYFVSRDGSAGDTKEVKKIVSKIKSGPSVLVAPEGTRSMDGKLLPFKKGGFLIALLAGVPVVPIVIWGGLNIRKKDQFKVESNKNMFIKILEPIDVSKLPRGRRGREELEHRVRSMMEEIINKQLELENNP